MNCPKCASRNVYSQDDEFACMMCGKRWLINGAKPIIVYKRSEEEDMESKKTPSGKVGPCANCGRSKFIAGAHGLCSACHYSVKDLKKDTPEYSAALAKAKDRLTDPNNKRCAKVKKLSPESIQKAKKNVRAMSIKHNGGDHDLAGPIAELTLSRDNLLLKADKLTKAIALLS